MKPLRPTLLASLFVTAGSFLLSPAFAQEPEKKDAKLAPTAEVGIFVEHIQIDQVTATKIVRGYDGDGSSLREKLQQLVESKKAEILESSFVIVRNGLRAKIQSIDEFIYPTEYDPPEMPDKVSGKVAEGVELGIPSNPTAFDFRRVGNSLEVGVNIAPGGDVVDLDIAPEVVEYIGDRTYGEGLSEAKQPVFFVLTESSNISISSGNYALLAVQTPRDPNAKAGETKNDKSQRVFVMVRATILKKLPAKE